MPPDCCSPNERERVDPQVERFFAAAGTIRGQPDEGEVSDQHDSYHFE